MKFLRFAEKILPLVFCALLIFGFDEQYLASLTIISAVIHEGGHIILGRQRGFERLFPMPSASGFRIRPKKTLSYKDELILHLGGPLANFIAAFASFLLSFVFPAGDYLLIFSAVNLMTAFSNLLPIKEHDGYKIIECIFLIFSKSTRNAERILSCLSFCLSTLLLFLSMFLILKIGEGWWIFTVFFTAFISELAKFSSKRDL